MHLQIHKRDGVTAQDIFELATIGGAKALGMDTQIGTLEPGKRADIIAVPLPSEITGDIYSDLLRETKSCIMTMVNGKIIWNDETAGCRIDDESVAIQPRSLHHALLRLYPH